MRQASGTDDDSDHHCSKIIYKRLEIGDWRLERSFIKDQSLIKPTTPFPNQSKSTQVFDLNLGKMSNSVCSVLVLFSLIFVSAQASRSLLTKPQPLPSFRIINTTTTHPLLAFSKVNSTTITATSQPLPPLKTKTATSQKENGACYYTVRFTTSCSSPSYTRDQISLDFGDAYGNEVYVPRIDDPYSGTFDACSVDTFDISGPCMYDTCYLYVYRSGYDGWKLNTVEVYGYNSITFYYNTFIPRDVWYGFDYCNGLSAST